MFLKSLVTLLLRNVPSQAEVVGCIVWWEGLHPVQVITIQSIAFLVWHTDHRQREGIPPTGNISTRRGLACLDLNGCDGTLPERELEGLFLSEFFRMFL
uniref:Secreted protein n=1 Tax=Anguilla anguilla TaxID=7936 RepID=A0A0E9TBA8_ANGAN